MMMRSMFSRALMTVCLAASPLLLVGCAGNQADGHESAQTGTFSMPLVSQANGHTYRLSASIYLYGPTYTTLYTSNNPDEKVLTATLQTGNYTAYLENYSLERDDGTGNFQPVQATLVSDYYVNFSIYNQSSTTISFQFQTDGVIVVIGQGQLNVTLGVTEVAPACTILGTDCPEGTWCPPPGLTGQSLRCVGAGSVAIGQPCTDPTSCVAGASCLDFGAGAVCGGICLAADVGFPCAKGGTCTKAAVDYGVCVPEGGQIPGGQPDGGPEGGAGGGSGWDGGPIETGGTIGIGGKKR